MPEGAVTDEMVEAAADRAASWFGEKPWWLRNMLRAAMEAADRIEGGTPI